MQKLRLFGVLFIQQMFIELPLKTGHCIIITIMTRAVLKLLTVLQRRQKSRQLYFVIFSLNKGLFRIHQRDT